MRISGLSGPTAYSARATSLEAQKTALDAKIFDLSTCTTTDAKTKASGLAKLEAQKAQVQLQMDRANKPADADPLPIREGSTIHVIA